MSSLPPLVQPAAELSNDEVARYSRHLIIPDVGMDGQKRLKNAKVLVIGAGGLGFAADAAVSGRGGWAPSGSSSSMWWTSRICSGR